MPKAASMCTATFWLTRLSSASSTRNDCPASHTTIFGTTLMGDVEAVQLP
jgi:hypothetical protein